MGTIIYLSHGGGPLPLLNDSTHFNMIEFMKDLSRTIKIPKAIIVVSAHWEEDCFTITGAKKPNLLYDYYGFPEEAYKITYPVLGDCHLAKKIHNALKDNEIYSFVDKEKGLDHGVFVPLKLLYPQADIPTIQISLKKGLDSKQHIELGKILREFINEDILLIGSGFSFHNMNGFDFEGKTREDKSNDEFQNWLIDLFSNKYEKSEIEQMLIDWEKAPSARYCHPREEHLIPLMVCFGASENPGEVVFDNYILGKRSLAVKW